MGWRTVIISKTAKLDYKMGYLVVRSNEEVNRIHLSEINVLVIESTAVSLTAYLLVELANQKVTIIFCDQKRNPYGQFIPLYGSHNTSDRIRKQTQWTNEIKQVIWQSIIIQKIRGQSTILRYRGMTSEADKLMNYLPQVEPGDSTNREGHAAKVYFNRLFGNDFSRADTENPINAELNYGYAILLSVVNREIVSNGYLTQIGLHHDNMFNEFNLSCDIMEPFRPYIDYVVLGLEHNGLTKEIKHSLVGILNRKVIIEKREQYFTNALAIYVKSVFDAIEKMNSTLIKYPDYELSVYESNSDV